MNEQWERAFNIQMEQAALRMLTRQLQADLNEQQEWDRAAHQHCHCGSRLVEQSYDGAAPLCIDCGYFDRECSCGQDACEFCGREP